MERGRENRTVQTRVARPTAGVVLDLQCQQALPWLQRAAYDKRHSGPNQQEMQVLAPPPYLKSSRSPRFSSQIKFRSPVSREKDGKLRLSTPDGMTSRSSCSGRRHWLRRTAAHS